MKVEELFERLMRSLHISPDAVATYTYTDGDQIVVRELTEQDISKPEHGFMSEPPFCAHCGGTCKCDDWKEPDYAEDE